MNRAVVSLMLLLCQPAFASCATNMEDEDGLDCNQYYSQADRMRTRFLNAFHDANQKAVPASCETITDADLTRRVKLADRKLLNINKRAQARNPDIDLTSFNGQTGYEGRLTFGNRYDECSNIDGLAAVEGYEKAVALLKERTLNDHDDRHA